MINTSALKQQQDIINILATQLEKEKARLKELQSVETKISKTLETLLPILSEYPEYKKAIASQLGLTLPTPQKPRVIEIEIIDEQESNPTPTITIKEIITELTSTFPEGWKYNETDSTWEMALTETEVTRITQNTNNPTGTIELKEKLYQWNLHKTDGDLPITILTLQEENNNDTTSDNNGETDYTYIDKSGDSPTPPTSDTVENKDTLNNPVVTWYKSSSGEVEEGSEKRYFRVFWNHAKDKYEIKFKKTTNSKKWIKANNSITQLFAEAILLELKAQKNHEAQAILEKLYEAAKEIGGKFVGTGTGDVGTLGYFYQDENMSHNDSIEVGYSDSSWWFIRPGHNKVYCDGDVNAFAQVLKGLAAETVKDAEAASTTTEASNGDKNILLWYDHNTGEITINQEKRYFKILWNSKLQEYQVSLKKSPSSQKWRKEKNPTAQKFVDAIMQEFKEYKPDTTNTKAEETTENQGKASDRKYTPPEITKLILAVLGEIDLDPAADDGKHIPAKKHYTIADDGLNQEWHGKVFMNPPYSCSGEWVAKLNSEFSSGRVTEAIALLPTSTDTKWFQPLWNQPICFWRGRITFLDENYEVLKSPARQSHCFIYWGENVDKFSQVFNKYGEITLPTKTKQETLTLPQKIQPYLPPTWILEEQSFDQVIIKEKKHPNNHVKFCNSTIGDIYIRHNQELLYTVNHQDIETAIDLIYCWFEQQKILITPSITNNNSNNQTGTTVEAKQKKEAEEFLTLTKQIQLRLSENWVLETINDNEVIIYESDEDNSNWVKITEISDKLNPFHISHGSAFFNGAPDIKTALDRAKYWFESTDSTDYFERFIEIINSYKADLTIVRNDSSTADIKIGQEKRGTIFYRDDRTLEIPEREKQLLKEEYSIDINELIQDISNKEIIDEGLINNYLLGIGSLDEEFDHLDTLHNALHSLSNKFKNKFRLVIIRQGRIFKIYNGIEWLENYLGSVKVNDSEIISDEKLIYKFLNNYSILLNQLTSDIATGETEIEIEKYIITSENLKNLLTKENWDNWNEEDFKTANNLLKELVDFSPAWNQLLETTRQQRKALIEQTIENDDNNPDNNGGSKTPPSTPKNPNNNGRIKPELNTEHLDTLETAINSYKTDLQLDKNCSQIAFYQVHSQLGSVTINQGKLLAESKLVSNLTVFYGIDIKGLIKSIKYASKHPGHELDPFAYIGSNNNAFKTLGCVVAPTWEKGRERRGILQSVSGQIATIQWMEYGVPGDNGIGYVNINLLRYVSALPLTKSDSSQVSTVSVESENIDTDKQTECDSDEPTAESITSLNFRGLIATQSTQPPSTVANTQLNTEELPETESIINILNNTVVEESPSNSSKITVVSKCDNDKPAAGSEAPLNLRTLIASQTTTSLPIVVDAPSEDDNSSTVNWYDSSSGEVIVGGDHRFFHILSDNSNNANTYYIGLKKSETAKSWSKNINVTTQKFIDAVWKDVEENPSKDTGSLVKELENAAAIAGGKFVSYTGSVCSLLGWFFTDKEAEEKIANVGYYKNSWWYYNSSAQERTYFPGDAASLVQVLKGLATEESPSNDPTESNSASAESIVEVDHTPSEQRETGITLTINSQNLTINGKAISFGHTLTELLSGNKTVTRRFWKDNYAKRFIDDWNAKPGEFLYPALTKGYHVGGKRVGYIRLTHKPYQEKLVDMPSSELAAEGFPELSKQKFIGKFFQGDNQQIVWVIRFEFIPNKEYLEPLSQQKKTQNSLEEQLINKVEEQLSLLDKFKFERTLGIPKITLHISLKDEILGRIFTDSHEGLVNDIPLQQSLMERYELDIKSLILDVVNGKPYKIEDYRKQPEKHTTTKGVPEIIENIASYFFDEYDDQTWLNLIKAEIELLEDFKASHDEVDLTVTHYGTNVGSIHYNQYDELEIEQKLIGELAKYDLDLEAFLVAENIPYKLYHPKPVVVTPTETSEHTKKSNSGSSNGSKTGSNPLNDDANKTATENPPVDLLDRLNAAFEGFDTIRTKRSGNVLWFYRGDENLNPCSMKTFDDNTSTLFPTVKLKSNMKKLYGIDIDRVCCDLETGKTVDINNYVDHSVWEQTIKSCQTNNETITWQDIVNNADDSLDTALDKTSTTEESNTQNYEHPPRLHWIKDTSMYNRSETYIVWNGTQKCGKIHIYNKGKKKANIGKWYVSPNVCGPYFETISEAAQACWQQLTESSKLLELELTPK